jgi:demethylmenaquinone methyltransferase/2-methoxy-6-polyprenyl-1,4-benzoquinol methylase
VLPDRVERATAVAAESGFDLSCDPEVGRLLAVLAAATPADGRILELGTGCGVGLAWIVHGLDARNDVEVLSIELDPESVACARQGAWPGFVSIMEGDALAVVPQSGTFDLVFADSEGGKWEGLGATIAALRPGGLLLVDDMTPAGWASDHHRLKTEEVRTRLLAHPQLVAAEMAHGTGIVLCTRRPS